MKSQEIKWIVENGVLSCQSTSGIFNPSADEIYSAKFEHLFSENFSKPDIEYLDTILKFSRYPLELNIELVNSLTNPFDIHLELFVDTNNGFIHKYDWNFKTDYVIINDVWHPIVSEAYNEILALLKSVGINRDGKITLRQYLELIKKGSGRIKNHVTDAKRVSSKISSGEIPVNIVGNLYEYQKRGWLWLKFMHQEQIGGILADEMGLGKSLQIISLIADEYIISSGPSLIICPSTLLENWRREFSKFSPKLLTHIHQGPLRTGFPNVLAKFNVIISSYETVTRDSSLFNQIQWNVLVCDEAQAIKNPQAKRSKAVKKIPRNIGIAVTGTPIENRLTDLWSIMDFAVPGYLGTQNEFETSFVNKVESAVILETLVSPMILRRRVSEVAQDLPSKIIVPQFIEMGVGEEEDYEKIRAETKAQLKENSSLALLTRLRMFCTHPFLVYDRPSQDPSKYSNKYKRLIEISEEIFENDFKLLVFTSYNKMNDIIVSDFSKRFSIYVNSIDGRTRREDRQKIIDEFSVVSGSAILVLNPLAAGAGLNITAANNVIHYNLEWNPAKEDQASARAYRRGQDRPVTIHRLINVNTVDEAIDERLTRKRQLSDAAIIGSAGEDSDFIDIITAINKSPKTK